VLHRTKACGFLLFVGGGNGDDEAARCFFKKRTEVCVAEKKIKLTVVTGKHT